MADCCFGPDYLLDAADHCYNKSFIDIAKQLEKLTLFLKYTPPSTLEEDKNIFLRKIYQAVTELTIGVAAKMVLEAVSTS